MNPIHLTILLPGMSSPPPLLPDNKQKSSVVEFDQLISRCVKSVGPNISFDAILFQLFAMDTDPKKDLPVAAVSHLEDTGEANDNYIFRADPVHLETNRDELVLFGTDVTALSDEVYKLIVDELCNSAHGENWKYTMPNKSRWYIEFQAPLDIVTFPLEAVVGAAISSFLPCGNNAQKLRSIFNETQMIMHFDSIVSVLQRQDQSTLINSLWFWGGGQLPQVSTKKETTDYWDELWTDNALALGLAKLNSVKSNKLPNSAHELLEHGINTGQHLLILESLRPVSNLTKIEDWWDQVKLINEHWIVLISEALDDGILLSLTIINCEGSQYYITKKELKRWWKRTRPFYSV